MKTPVLTDIDVDLCTLVDSCPKDYCKNCKLSNAKIVGINVQFGDKKDVETLIVKYSE